MRGEKSKVEENRVVHFTRWMFVTERVLFGTMSVLEQK